MESSIHCGTTRYEYSKEQIENLYCALDSNGWDMVKAFEVAWEDPDTFGNAPRHYGAFVLRMMEKLTAYKTTRCRDFNDIWKSWNRDNEELYSCTITNINKD